MANELALLGAGASGSSGGIAGPNFPGTAANDSAVGTVAWTDPDGALAVGLPDASASLTLAVQSNYLKLTNFGFSIPAGATVLGVKVTVSANSSTGAFVSTVARLVVGGVVSGDDKGASLAFGLTSDLGGAADSWGLSLTGADVNGSNFGFVLSTTGNTGRGSAVAKVDYVQITVYY